MSVARTEQRSVPQLSGWVCAIAALQLALLISTSTRYGYHRDELYFIVAGSHPAIGYPDQPAFVPLLAWSMHQLSHSLLLLRLPIGIASAAMTVVSALITREIGGGRRAQLIAAACTASSLVGLGHIVSTASFDFLSTTVFLWLVIRALMRGSEVLLLLAGVVVGLGSEAKPLVGVAAVVAVGAVAIVGPRWPLRSRWAWGGGIAAVVLATPYMIWQQQHGWPQLTVAGHLSGSTGGGRVGFVVAQLALVGLLLTPIWVAGLLAPFRRSALRDLRFLPWTFLGLALLYLMAGGKSYYLASFYPALLGLGALPAAGWTRRRRLGVPAMAAALVLTAAPNAYVALPLLPEHSLPGSAVVAINPDQAETVGWPRFVSTVAGAWHRLTPAQRAHTAIFTSNYGEAGAIDVLGRGLPSAYSGHDGFSQWGEPPPGDSEALVIGYQNASEAAPEFRDCRTLATIDDGIGLDNQEQGEAVQLCRPSASWAALWPHLVHYD